ncbi:MAG TPA: carboxypeptidase regulatory-like domain-containing protein [Gemmatimonadaceae bacterium]|nr:carboxypeptidase regulatory-like domain-containing protein [Gemmatimonadaceae bacterium]
MSIPRCAIGQSAPVLVAVDGVAYDSLRRAPLEGALISISGTGRTTVSDSRGHFRFAGVPLGRYTFVMLHAALDSLGLSGTSTRAVIHGEGDTVYVAIPSFSTLWRAACGASDPPADSGFIFGTVRTLHAGAPGANTVVTASWLDIGFDKAKGVTQKQWRAEVRPDSSGDFSVCGVPTDVELRLSATNVSTATGVIEMPPANLRIRRRDLLLGTPANSARENRGTISGLLRDVTGQPVVGARVLADDRPEVRSGADGRFVIPDLESGTRQVTVLAIGAAPLIVPVDVRPSDSSIVFLELQKITQLTAVTVTARSIRQRRIEDMEERRRSGFGHVVDSTTVGIHGSITDAISMMANPRSVCKLYIDGVRVSNDQIDIELKLRSPRDVAVLEALRGIEVPMEWRPPGNCVVLLMWTKGGLP